MAACCNVVVEAAAAVVVGRSGVIWRRVGIAGGVYLVTRARVTTV